MQPAIRPREQLDAALGTLDHSWRHVHMLHMILGGVLARERAVIESLRACGHMCVVDREPGPRPHEELLRSLAHALGAMASHEHQYRELQADYLAARAAQALGHAVHLELDHA